MSSCLPPFSAVRCSFFSIFFWFFYSTELFMGCSLNFQQNRTIKYSKLCFFPHLSTIVVGSILLFKHSMNSIVLNQNATWTSLENLFQNYTYIINFGHFSIEQWNSKKRKHHCHWGNCNCIFVGSTVLQWRFHCITGSRMEGWIANGQSESLNLWHAARQLIFHFSIDKIEHFKKWCALAGLSNFLSLGIFSCHILCRRNIPSICNNPKTEWATNEWVNVCEPPKSQLKHFHSCSLKLFRISPWPVCRSLKSFRDGTRMQCNGIQCHRIAGT